MQHIKNIMATYISIKNRIESCFSFNCRPKFSNPGMLLQGDYLSLEGEFILEIPGLCLGLLSL